MSSGSLVKYNTPILVNLGANKKGKGEKKEKGPTVTQTEDILNSILPPREWTEDGQLWVQYVSSTPATRLDVVNLQQHLDHQLQARQARETGICPIREELYAQCFGKSPEYGTFESRKKPLFCGARFLTLFFFHFTTLSCNTQTN